VVTKDTCDLEETKRVGIGHASASTLPKNRGVLSGKKEDKLGWRASDTRELIFQDAVVPRKTCSAPRTTASANSCTPSTAGASASQRWLWASPRAPSRVSGVYVHSQTIRPADCGLPRGALRPRGHGHGDRSREAARLSRGLAQATRSPVQEGSGDGQVIRLRTLHAGHDQGRSTPWGLWLHDRVSGQAHDTGRQDLRNRRGTSEINAS
jgi:hypothetical protein